MSAVAKTDAGLKLGDHQFPDFDGLSAAFGAERRDYPKWEDIPEKFRRRNPHGEVFSALFFNGGKLADHGLTMKAGLDAGQVMRAIKALMSSFDPSHELKEATVAWALSEWFDGTPRARQ